MKDSPLWLFRGKDLKTDQWATGYLVICEQNMMSLPVNKRRPILCHFGRHGGNIYVTARHFVDFNTLSLWTGLEDYSGNKIFHGDVVVHDATKKAYIVKWVASSAGFRLWSNADRRYYDFGNNSVRAFDIIGNIYDNPDLIDVV